MAISNVETGASKTDYDVRAHRSDSRNGNSKTHNRHEKAEQPGESPRKEDSVTISDEAKELSERKELRFSIYDWEEGPLASFQGHGRPEKGSAEWQAEMEGKIKINNPSVAAVPPEWNGMAEKFIFESLNGKMENAMEVASQLGSMVFKQDDWNSMDLETRAENREAGRELAKYIAENYFDDPKEAQAFIDKINMYIENSERRDKGYAVYFAEQAAIIKCEPPSDEDRWLDANWDKYFGHLDVTRVKDDFGNYSYIGLSPNRTALDYEFREAWRAAMQDLRKEQLASFEKNPAPYSVSKTKPTWEEDKEYNCKYSMYNEQNKAWYAEFDAKSKIAQDIINKAKSITDFSGNERWNIVMNLISGNKTTQEHL